MAGRTYRPRRTVPAVHADRPPEPASVYRCAECGHGRHLAAWGNAAVYGPLGAGGEIEEYEYDDLWEVHEDSIRCIKHPCPDATLEKNTSGRWCRWYTCPHGASDNRDGRCAEAGITAAGGDGTRLVHAGWDWKCPWQFMMEAA